MNIENLQIRIATVEDSAALLDIYKPYVEKTAVTFEYEVPSLEEFSGRIERILKKYPVLVAECENMILGYAYAGAFQSRAAYAWAVETSIYIREDSRKLGIGRFLYGELENILRKQNIVNVNACIAYPIEEDTYLSKDSVKFHEKMGYRMVGEFRKCGYKFNRWYNMVWMEKHIGEHQKKQPPVKVFSEIYKEEFL
ncbi:MAG: GNAT family N-acetyltransferase [Roseburia sp.]|nr:GNAT family N-acetyltransferase [Roseburia sp.]